MKIRSCRLMLRRRTLRLHAGKMKKGIRAGDKFPVTIKLKNNHKDKKLINVRLQVDSADGISLAAGQKTDQIKVGNLEPEEEKKVKRIKLVADQLPEEKSTLELKTVCGVPLSGRKVSRAAKNGSDHFASGRQQGRRAFC